MHKIKSTLSLKGMIMKKKQKKLDESGRATPSAEANFDEEMPSPVLIPPNPTEKRASLSPLPAPEAKKFRKSTSPSPEKENKSPNPGTLCSRKSLSNSNKSLPLASKFGRHIVLEVARHLSEIHLDLKKEEEQLSQKFLCILRGSWINTQVKPGDVVNVLADFNSDLEAYVIDNLTGLLVVNPDFLLSGTSIVSTLFCMRKSVLNEMYKGTEGRQHTTSK